MLRNRVVVAVSGSGRSLANLISQEASHGYSVVGVIASSPRIRAVQIAEDANLPVLVVDMAHATRSEEDIYEWLIGLDAELVVLAGFLKLFPVKPKWENRIINIHPALLPQYGGPGFYGDRVHRQVLEANDSISGASVHFANNKYDDGALISQAKVSLTGCNRVEEIAGRVFEVESQLLPATVGALFKGELPLADGKVKVYEFDE